MTTRGDSSRPGYGLKTLWWAVPAAVGLVVAVAVATWWLVGDQSTVPASANPDHVLMPFAIGPRAERAAGIASTVLTVIALALLVLATRRRNVDPRWWRVLVPLLAVGLIVGSGWRVVTAGVIGANIGAAVVVTLGGPVVVALLLWALAYAIRLLRKRST
ncbi:hypothetical protein ACFFX1_50275 [Dactylosporangium sucinum]|uniref:Uncharacterized protein n=1 Tax=Dactylosporangium sucinum TaxID=1424081 RepID=A0A917UEC6_9ACTN|nr:hypothetical protein [Dactylosporangium sucinum]GGM87072.1 hypothetical protein GCM10007977_106260 [Dactylosporangium sucinum]